MAKIRLIFAVIVIGGIIIFSIQQNQQARKNEIEGSFKDLKMDIKSIEMTFNSIGKDKKTIVIENQDIFKGITTIIANSEQDMKRKGVYDISCFMIIRTMKDNYFFLNIYYDVGVKELDMLFAKDKDGRRVSMSYVDSNSFWKDLIEELY